ncbi:LacI family transcriptional regulator [Rathayibacter caricis]|uniref:LacI family DNA-binding transcriptional regulator n=1 Tax=Rathayibacter caricis TaxID=110936 RepID=UPI001FB44FBA|nr:LacI family DNA-binding transcriptional regulator [Rathayibacter caricis]MCJ1697993.1 LacI family transcriptional regulator [Rathayibacter caricis]
MPGIKEVAERAGVSQATASRALSGRGSVSAGAQRRVKEAAAELGFVASYHASSLATGRSRNIGVVLPYVNRWYFSTVLAGITAPLIEAGYDLSLYDFQGDRHRATVMEDFLLRKRLDGVITVGLRLADADVEQLLSMNVPMVSIGGRLDGVDSLSIDDEAVGHLATDHLISLGHTRIAHLGGENESPYYFRVSRARRDGYTAALREAALEQRAEWSVICDYTVEGAYRDAKSLLADPRHRPTGIVCASDEMAIGVILAARDLAIRIPDQLSVIGVDRHPLGEVFGLTTIDQFADQQGSRAVQALLSRLEGKDDDRPAPTTVDLPIRIVARASTSAPPRHD